MNQPELLSPAGSLEALYAAIKSGCNAVYFGGKNFSARSYASNFSIAEIEEAVSYAKPRGVKCYVTLNTLIKESEMEDVYAYLKEIYHIGVDACIIQDVGLARLIKTYFPNMEIHGSTQMSVHSIEGVRYLKKIGFSRVVLSRELTIKEINKIVKETDIEIECFIHGALCYSYSGQCLMSSFIGGRSGNRGKCAQPCRLSYNMEKDHENIYKKNKYLMSLKDMNTLEIIPQLLDAGIHSFKIEGRMKRVEYVAGVTSIYRKYMEQYFATGRVTIEGEDQENITQLFNRGGFSKGYYESKKDMIFDKNPKNAGVKIGDVAAVRGNRITLQFDKDIHKGDGIEILTNRQPHPGFQLKQDVKKGQSFTVTLEGSIRKGQSVYRTKDHRLLKNIQETIKKSSRKTQVNARVIATEGQAFRIHFFNEDYEVVADGDIVEAAKGSPVTEERLIKQVKKLGNTAYEIKDLDMNMDQGIFVSIAMVNDCRRRAIALMDEKIMAHEEDHAIQSYKPVGHKEVCDTKELTVLVQNKQQFKVALEHEAVKRIYVEEITFTTEEIRELLDMPRNGKDIYIALPYISRNKVYGRLAILDELMADGYLIRTYGQMQWVKKNSSKKYIVDYTLNLMNNYALIHWKEENIEAMTLSTELSYNEILQLRENHTLEYFGYGNLPMMMTEQCLIKDSDQCKMNSEKSFRLVDRKNNKFKILRNCRDCNSLIYNIHPICLLKNSDQMMKLPVNSIRLSFTDESDDLMMKVIKGYQDALTKRKVDPVLLDIIEQKGFTRGHYLRGVE
ncbi:U32 family peptidase [Vallitalea okinawensis]|uniref:U32 family peptidase n=1 Tax=Vallitalea okinawensis TaxID=2078660 RepID=UPI000CFDA5E0|nr:U32 family peptidase [Vallitalea okinawensis]